MGLGMAELVENQFFVRGHVIEEFDTFLAAGRCEQRRRTLDLLRAYVLKQDFQGRPPRCAFGIPDAIG